MMEVIEKYAILSAQLAIFNVKINVEQVIRSFTVLHLESQRYKASLAYKLKSLNTYQNDTVKTFCHLKITLSYTIFTVDVFYL